VRLTRIGAALGACLLGLVTAGAFAQQAYKYRDASGQWVFTDRAPPATVTAQPITVSHGDPALHIKVTRLDADDATRLMAANDCLCTVTVRLQILESEFADLAAGTVYQATVPARSDGPMLRMTHAPGQSGKLTFQWQATLGAPDAVHAPSQPYRVPYGIGSTFAVTQAYPDHITHTSPDSEYAIDFALPDDTPVYAAREGVVINVRHDSFRGAADPVMIDQANLVDILHDDGTIALYGHLHWDSIRVRIGDRVVRGQYIADSGNTGFSSGPHLHFAVIRNGGGQSVSVPVQFSGFAGVPVSAAAHGMLTAY
jgi:murein DD-endopeptidase MepM/ murein hydrolase activator NlpD